MKCPIFIVYLKKVYFTEQTLLIKIRTISLNTLLPTRNNFFYAGIIKCSRPGDNKFIECLLSILCISEAFLLQDVVEAFEKIKVCR